MKKIFWSMLSVVMAAVMSVVFIACSSDDDPDEVTVYPPQVTFGAEGGQQMVTIKSNTKWTVSGMMAGVTVAPTQGNGDGTITLIATENTEKTNRSGFFTVNAGDASATIMVTQSPKTVDNALEGNYVGTLKPVGYSDLPAPCYITITKLASTTYRLSSIICEEFNWNSTTGYNLVAKEESDGRITLTSETSYSIDGGYFQGNLTLTIQNSNGVSWYFSGVKS